MYYRQVKDKNILTGDNKLFPKVEWVPAEELFGENQVLKHPIMHKAFERILNQHKVIHSTALLSLCTDTRPYHFSLKWKKYLEYFDKKVDFIVVSNGGMIPEDFWLSYPFLNYDAGVHENDELYKKIMYERMILFFKKHSYKYVIANFSYKQRNAQPAKQSLTKLKMDGFIKDFIVIPDVDTYKEAQKRGWVYGAMFPDLHPIIFKKIINHVELWGDKVVQFDV